MKVTSPSSPEVVAHHIVQHGHLTDGRYAVVLQVCCPCDSCDAFLCSVCGELLAISAPVRADWCVHAHELIEPKK